MLHTYARLIMARQSDVWDFFEKLGSNKAKCMTCCKNFAYKEGTTNLRDHLVAKHSDIYQRVKKGNQQGAAGCGGQTSIATFCKPRVCTEARAREITDWIVNMIALDFRPVSTVDGEGFISLMNYMEPAYKWRWLVIITVGGHFGNAHKCSNVRFKNKRNIWRLDIRPTFIDY